MHDAQRACPRRTRPPDWRRAGRRGYGCGISSRRALPLLVAALALSLCAVRPAAASVRVGQTGGSPFSCGSLATTVLWQRANVTGPGYRVPSGGGVITSWTTGGGAADGLRARLEVVDDSGAAPVVVGESALETGIAHPNALTFPVRIPVAGGEALGLEIDASMASICTLATGVAGDVIDGGPDPGPGNAFASVGTPDQGVLNVSAVVEPDADRDGFGDESQDSCPSEAAVHDGACRSGATRIGQAFAPTTACDQGTYAAGAVPAGTSYAVPAAGVLTSWDVEGPPAPHADPIDLEILRPTGPAHTYRVVAQSGLLVVAGPGPHAFPARVPVEAGDVIGFYSDSNLGWCGDFMRGADHDFVDVVSVPLGQETAFMPEAGTDFRADVAATIEPDRDGDGFGDLSQDACPTDPSRQSACAVPQATAASLSGASQSARRWRAGRRLPVIGGSRRRPGVGTTFRFTLDRAAAVRFAFVARRPGRRVGLRCLPPTGRNRTRNRCTRLVPAGTLRVAGHAGLNAVGFEGGLSRHRALRPGRYVVTITATTADGLASAPQTLAFTIVA